MQLTSGVYLLPYNQIYSLATMIDGSVDLSVNKITTGDLYFYH